MARTYRFDVTPIEHQYDLTLAGMQRNLLTAYKKLSRKLIAELQNLYREWLLEKDKMQISHIFQYEKYYKLVQEMEEIIKQLGELEESILDAGLKKMYEETQSILQGQMRMDRGIDHTAEKVVLRTAWAQDGQRWSDRIWRDKGALVEKMKQGLFDVAAAGRSPDELKLELIKDFDVSFSSADRIVRTELSHIQNQACMDAYKKLGVQKVKFIAYKDERTCKQCGALDGKVFDMSDAQTTINTPPIHPNCRCTLLGIIE